MELNQPNCVYEQGEMVLIPFPYSDLTGSKQRPALILSNHRLRNTKDKICCLITTKPQEEDMRIDKENFQEGGLPFISFVRPYRIFTIHGGIIRKRLGKITLLFHNKIISRINTYMESEK